MPNTERLNVSREVLSDFLPDPRTVREFEKMVNTINSTVNTTETIDNAVATVNAVSSRLDDIFALLDRSPSPLALSDILVLQERLDALEMLPPPLQLIAPRFGMFYDTTSQTAAAANTAYAVTFDSTMSSQGVTIVSSSQITVDRPGRFNINWAVHPNNSGGTTHNIWSWLRKNGADVAYTTVHSTLSGSHSEQQNGGRHLVELAAGEYVEIYWATDDTGVSLETDAASAFAPAGPSATVSVTNDFASQTIVA